MKDYIRARIGKRILAAILDYLVLYVLATLVGLMLFQGDYFSMYTIFSTKNAPTGILSYLYPIFVFVIVLLYYILLPLKWKKQTVGRNALKIRVVKNNGKPATVTEFCMREIVGAFVASIISAICGIGIIMDFLYLIGDNPTSIRDNIGSTKMVDLNKPTRQTIKNNNNNIIEDNGSYNNETIDITKKDIKDEDEDYDEDVLDFTDPQNQK